MTPSRRPLPFSVHTLALVLAALTTMSAACSGASGVPSATAIPTASAMPSDSQPPVTSPEPGSASPSTSAAPSEGAVIATFRVSDEEYRILLTDPADIEMVRAWEAGEFASLIPNGRVVRDGDGGVNTGWSWHIDPADIDFADGTTEVCDGLPSDVERAMISGDRFCPWSAELVSLEPAD